MILNLLSLILYLIVDGGLLLSADEVERSLLITGNLGDNIAISHGYTSLGYGEGYDFNNFQFIGNAKVHYLNDSNWASNFGMVFRYPKDTFDLEFNFFYDALINQYMHHQLGVGGGYLSPAWDTRFNIYLPVGRKTHTVKSTRFDYPGGYRVDCFQKRTDLAGIDIECGKLFNPSNAVFQSYAAIGGYGYLSKHIDHILGVRARLTCAFWNRLKADLILTHDRVFKTSVQFSLSISIQGSVWNLFLLNRQDLIVREPKCNSWKTNY